MFLKEIRRRNNKENKINKYMIFVFFIIYSSSFFRMFLFEKRYKQRKDKITERKNNACCLLEFSF